MRGRRPAGPEYADKIAGSDVAKERVKVILATMMGQCRVQEACERLGICEQRFHQLRAEMMLGAVQALEPGHAGRPAQSPSPEQARIDELVQQLEDKEIDLQAAKARAEIAVVMPEIIQKPAAKEVAAAMPGADEPEKKSPRSSQRRRRGRKTNT